MSNVPSDLIGDKRGDLIVISLSNKKGKAGQEYLNCKCKCGNKTSVRKDNFLSGHTYSCGCRQKKVNKENRVNITINNMPSKKARISAEQTQLGKYRRCIEDILASRALKRELSLDNY